MCPEQAEDLSSVCLSEHFIHTIYDAVGYVAYVACWTDSQNECSQWIELCKNTLWPSSNGVHHEFSKSKATVSLGFTLHGPSCTMQTIAI